MDKLVSGEFSDYIHVPLKDLSPWELLLGNGLKKKKTGRWGLERGHPVAEDTF